MSYFVTVWNLVSAQTNEGYLEPLPSPHTYHENPKHTNREHVFYLYVEYYSLEGPHANNNTEGSTLNEGSWLRLKLSPLFYLQQM